MNLKRNISTSQLEKSSKEREEDKFIGPKCRDLLGVTPRLEVERRFQQEEEVRGWNRLGRINVDAFQEENA